VRDPSAHFAERRGRIAGVTRQERIETDGHVEELVALTSTSGLAVELALKSPLDAAPPGGRPLCVLLGGIETGRKALRFVPDTRGSFVAALSYPYTGPPKPKGLAVVGASAKIRAAVRDTPPAVELALDWLMTLPEVDPARVELVGVSLGAPFACIAGALDPRFTRVWVLHGGGDVPAMLDAGLRRKVGFAPARWLVARGAWIAIGGDALAPERWIGRIAPRPVIVGGAEDDERVPRACTELLFAAAGEPRELFWTGGGHIDTDRLRIAGELVDRVLSRVSGR
jgi:dienelactone hydrolase